MTIRPIFDIKNRIRNELDEVVQAAGQKLGNEIKGYTLVVWGNDADKPEVYYLKGGLTKGYLPQFAFNAICNAFLLEDAQIEIVTDVGIDDAEDS